ncbi:hypothetical protein ABK040_014390 [Willaertia magna]
MVEQKFHQAEQGNIITQQESIKPPLLETSVEDESFDNITSLPPKSNKKKSIYQKEVMNEHLVCSYCDADDNVYNRDIKK